MKIKISKSQWEEMGKKAGWRDRETEMLRADIINTVKTMDLQGLLDIRAVCIDMGIDVGVKKIRCSICDAIAESDKSGNEICSNPKCPNYKR
jgi:hypothetical protein